MLDGQGQYFYAKAAAATAIAAAVLAGGVAAVAIAVAAVALTRNDSWKIHAWRSAVLFN